MRNRFKIKFFILILVSTMLFCIVNCRKYKEMENSKTESKTAFKSKSPSASSSSSSKAIISSGRDNPTSEEAARHVINYPCSWFKFRADLRNTGTNPRVSGPKKLNILWKLATGHEVMSSPSINSDGDIFIGSHDGNLYHIKPDGKGTIFCKTEETIVSTPLLTNNFLAWGGFDGIFYCVGYDKSPRFKLNPADWIGSSPNMLDNGNIIFSSRNGILYCLNPDGKEEWKFEMGKSDYEIQSSPAIWNRRIFVGSGDGNLYCISNKGKLIWKFGTESGIFASPAVDEKGNVYVGSWDGNFYCISPDGKKIWSFKTGGKITSSATITDHTGLPMAEGHIGGLEKNKNMASQRQIVFGSCDGYIYSLDIGGNLLWKFNTGGAIESSPASDREGNIFVGSDSGKMIAMSSKGEKNWEFQTEKPILSSPAINEKGNLIFGCEDKRIYCIGEIIQTSVYKLCSENFTSP